MGESSVPGRAGMTKKLFIKTYGCQMNAYDSGRMVDVMATAGYACVTEPEGADMVILNTCHIREKAAEKVYSELGRLRAVQEQRRQDGGRMVVAVAGCVAQAEGEEILARAPQVDIVLGPQTYHRLPQLVERVLEGGEGRVADLEFPPEDKFDRLPEEAAPRGVSAFLTIQEGCDKFCTFCVVPYTRGVEQSRDVAGVVAEATRLAAAGSREITLLGQNVNAWRGATPEGGMEGLGRLVRRLAALDGIERIRYTTSHPRDVDDEQIAAHRDVPQLMPYLHLPAQSGSDRILAAMNRRYSADDYRRITDRLRAACPDLALSSDFIVGFPGETDEDFAATLRLVRDIGYAGAFSFKYSIRPGTPAGDAAGHVPEEVKRDRLEALQQVLRAQQEAFNHSRLGSVISVLLEGPGRKPGQLVGRSPWLQPVHLEAGPGHPGSPRPGDIVRVRITAVHPNSLGGELAEPGFAVPGAVDEQRISA